MNRSERRAHNARMRALPAELEQVLRSDWPPGVDDGKRFAVWRSRKYLVQLFDEPNGDIRMTVCRTTVNRSGQWEDNLTWDELQAIKRTVGYGALWAIELYPPDDEVVNVANMRHLWIMAEAPPTGWKRG